MPQATSTTASGVTSKMVKGACPSARDTPSTSRLVDVPISVSVPPRMAA